jgi:3-hydroxyacyl-CoA dehydrogenase
MAALVEGRGEAFARHFLGTHFFNPPRYLHLVELIPSPATEPAVIDRIAQFTERQLGKGVVLAKDSPNFIANHLGIYGAVLALRALESGQYTIEEIDAITGPAIGRPKSATFRTMDLAGLDIVAEVARTLGLPLPRTLAALVERGWLGDKSGQGFYKRERAGDGRTEILTLDPATMTYRPRQPARLPSIDAARAVDDAGQRTRMLFYSADKAGAFLRETLEPLIAHATEVAPSIAHSIDDVDRAMRWGFGWPLGPFELADLLAEPGAAPLRDRPLPGGILRACKAQHGVVRRNAGASLVDIGDGVLAIELHSKMNALGGDAIEMIRRGLAEAAANFRALVIATDAPDFSVGANLLLILLEAQEGNWDDIDAMVRTFQAVNMALRRAPVPVVAAVSGRALGGGGELLMHADRVQAAGDSFIGLVETGVGLIPAGGGTKEMLARATAHLAAAPVDLLPHVQQVFETIAFATVSASAPHAQQLGYLRAVDRVTMNRDRVLADAKAFALERVRDGYQPAPVQTAIPVGGDGLRAALELGIHLARRAGRISDHDALVARTLAHVVAGGRLPNRTTVGEAYLLDLEREAFLKLCGERKTLERMRYTLDTGKPLRN